MSPLLFLLFACRSPGETDVNPSDSAAVDSSETGETGHTAVVDPRFADLPAILQAELNTTDAPSVSVAVMEKGELVFAGAFGSKTIGGDEAVNTDTLFQIGSVTKMFTALGLLQQKESQGFSLDMTLAEAYADSEFAKNPDWNDQITLEHLLTHQSGMFDWLGDPSSANDNRLRKWFQELYFPYGWLMAPPGLFYNYNNPGYSLAGLLMEQLDPAARAYPDIMAEEVFGPLGMERTYQRHAEARKDGNYTDSYGYKQVDGEWEIGAVGINELAKYPQGRPAGSSTWSTPTQIMEMARFLMEGNSEVLSEQGRESMVAAQVPIYATPYDMDLAYGYGLTTFNGLIDNELYTPEIVWSHDGATNSFSASLWILPEKEAAVCILNSAYGTSFPLTGYEILRILTENDGDPVGEIPMLEHDPSQIPYRAGDYIDANNFGRVSITQEDNELTVSMPDLEALGFSYQPNLVMDRDDHWYVMIDNLWYSWLFWGEDDTPSDYVVNRAMVATRIDQTQSMQPVPFTPNRERVEAALREMSKASPVPSFLRAHPKLDSVPR